VIPPDDDDDNNNNNNNNNNTIIKALLSYPTRKTAFYKIVNIYKHRYYPTRIKIL
jgi:hypothetical protein